MEDILRFILVFLIVAGCSDNTSKPGPGEADTSLDSGALTDASNDSSTGDVGDLGVEPWCVTTTGSFPRRLLVPDSEPNGFFDPSLALDPATQRLWMSYSGVTGPAGSGAVSTHLAYSDDGGDTWCDGGLVNSSEPEPNPPAEFAGLEAKWNHETSSIVYDPDAPANARWKVNGFWPGMSVPARYHVDR